MERLSLGGLAVRSLVAPLLSVGLYCRSGKVSRACRYGGSERPIACGDGKLQGTICAQENSMRLYTSPANAPFRRLVMILTVSLVLKTSASGFGGLGSILARKSRSPLPMSIGVAGLFADVIRMRMVI